MNDVRKIRHAFGEVQLHNASGVTFALEGTGSQLFNWAPVSKVALDLELRVQPIFPGFVNDVPVWTYALELAHGDATIFSQPGEAVAVLKQFALPHRGLVARFTAREFRLTVQFQDFLGPTGIPDRTQVQVSIQPAISASRPTIVQEDQFVTGLNPLRFPPEANEWRLRSMDGQPIAVGINTVVFLAISGIPIATPIDAALLFDWQPIPVLAHQWATFGDPCVAQYR